MSEPFAGVEPFWALKGYKTAEGWKRMIKRQKKETKKKPGKTKREKKEEKRQKQTLRHGFSDERVMQSRSDGHA